MLEHAWDFLEGQRTLIDAMLRGRGSWHLYDRACREVALYRNLPTIVCLCGSIRFIDQFRDANLRKTLEGEIVLSIGSDNQYEGSPIAIDDNAKAMLDALHFRKIELADYIHVLNINGYIGKSTLAEVKHAVRLRKPVTFEESEGVWLWNSATPGVRYPIDRFIDAQVEIVRMEMSQ